MTALSPLWPAGAGTALGLIAAMALLTWAASVVRRDASLVDRVWPLFFVAAALAYAHALPGAVEGRALVVLVLVAAWGLRLSIYLSWRNWGQGEDRRYQAIRARHEPGFAWKSLVIIFALQALLAWVIGWPIGVAMGAPPVGSLAGTSATQAASPGVFDALGTALAAFGIVFEALADGQMARFKADPAQQGRVMDRGLWGLCRHPNYFGEACVWWGLWLLALGAAGGAAAWSVISPLLITGLLLKVSGVSLLEADIAERRPAYADYVRHTPAFLPRWPRQRPAEDKAGPQA